MIENAALINVIDVYDFTNYREYLKSWIAAAPNAGRGQASRISEAAVVHKTTLSQIIGGTKELTLDQAFRISEYFHLSSPESLYFVLLVEYERAGSSGLKELFKKQIEEKRKKKQQLSSRVTRTRALSSEERAIYYSNWIYSAVRNLSAIPLFRNPREMGNYLGLERRHLKPILDFLISTGLCKERDGEIFPGPQMTHLEASSPLVSRHHGNWRVKSMERHPVMNEQTDIAYTAPMTLSSADAMKVRKLIMKLVQNTDEIVVPSESERLYCMCLDWFEVR